MSGFHRLHNLRMENDAAGYEMEEQRGRFEALKDRHTNGTAPRAVVAYQLFQTPPELAARMAALLNPAYNASLLEPSAGLGNLLDALFPYLPAEIVAIDISAECTGELFRQNRPNVTIWQRDFLDVNPTKTGLFDGVLMNPPFHLRSDIAHVLHALEFLRPGGRLVTLLLDTRHRAEALQLLADTWEPLPLGTFGKAGTNVATVLASFIKK